MSVDFNLDGVHEHRVQSDVIFKLRCTKDKVLTEVNYPVEAFLKGAHDEVKADVSYHFGTYTLNFFPRVVGMYEMHVKVNNHWLYKDSDVVLNIVDQLAKKFVDLIFELDGAVLQGNLKAGNMTQLVIYSKTGSGVAHDIDLTELEVRVGQGSSLQKLRTRQIGTGAYDVDFRVDLPGFYMIDVLFEERSVLKEPVRVQFTTASDPKNTKACQVPTNMVTVGQEASFYIQSRNKNDLNNTCGGDLYEVHCDGPADLTDLVVRDSLNGKYMITFTPTETGVYDFNILLNGIPIGNSPVSISAVKR